MRSPVLVLALVGLVFGARQPGWKDNTEYVYRVDGRSLTSLNELSDQYSGIFIKAKLHVSPRSDGKLQAWICESQYAQIHSQMPNGWNSAIPESQLSFKQLGLSKKPFQIISQNGLIKSLVVEKDVANWEANVIKSIVSQFQLDLQGKRAVESHVTALPNDEKMEAVFQTMEDTITGETETNYDIHQLPEYLVESQPWLVPQQQLQGQGKIYEVIKSKNYTTNRAMPAYQYGFGEVQEGKPTGNRMGDFLTRSAISRVVLTGQLSKYTIQSSQTVNKITIKPTLNGKRRGSAVSSLNMTLLEVRTQTKQPQEMSSPIDIGNLVYTYVHPFASSNKVQQKLQGNDLSGGESEENTPREKRSLFQSIKKSILGENSEANSEEQVQYQMRPQMDESPESPLLPYYMGYHGKSIKANSDFDVKETAQRMSREISDDLEQPDQILTQSTLSKYAMLVSLVRLMNQKEISAVTQQLYKPEQQQQQGSWMAFRDAVSEAGTGPAFLAIEEWISTKKTEKGEAAELIASMANSVRVPTEEYMQKFFALTQNPDVMRQEQLNETSVLSFTRLVNKVYAKKTESQNQFPASSFRSFYTKDGKDFVKTVVIPSLSQQLDEAVMRADSRKIHVAIRALGNIGDKKVLEAFEPYLEGQKQASQYQRMLMILSLDKLVDSNPTIAQAVMYRIYQNIAEVPEVRVAAVYQLMRTDPPAQMLQRMAQSTNVDTQEDVNSAVKSAIESLSQLEAAESQSLRKAAESAIHLLTKKQYGKQRSANFLSDFVIKSLNVDIKQNFMQTGSTDQTMPKGVKYSVRGNINGLKHYFANVQATVSSIQQLTEALHKQTESHQNAQQQRSRAQQSDGKWSSAKIAEILNLQTNEKEQLEGFINAEIESMQKLWSFDNQTIEQLPEVIREKEQMMKNGKQFQYTKLKQLRQMALSLPTELGLPFLYTYDIPLLIQAKGNVAARANPEISNGKVLRTPEEVSAQIEAFTTVSAKVQSQLSVITPFDHQVYTAGNDKNMHIHLPMKANVEIDIPKKSITIEIESKENHKNARLFHFSSWPFTSRSDVMSLTPVALRPNTHYIKPENVNAKPFDFVWGKKETGMSFRVWGSRSQQPTSLWQFIDAVRSQGVISALSQVWDPTTLEQTEVNVEPDRQNSPNRKIKINAEFQSQYNSQPKTAKKEEFYNLKQMWSRIDGSSQSRQQELLRHVSSGINNAWSKSVDASMEFVGEQSNKHIISLAFAKSNVNPESRMVFAYKNNAQKPSEASLEVKGHIPNTNELDVTTLLNTNVNAKYEALWQQSQEGRKPTNVRAMVDMSRSESRRKSLEKQPMYQVCKNEMEQGNRQLAACQNMTIEANFLNDIKAEIKYENVQPTSAKHLEYAFQALRIAAYPNVDVSEHDSRSKNEEIHLRVEFEPRQLRQFNVSVIANNQETKFNNVPLSQLTKTALVPHATFNFNERLQGQLLAQDNIKPTCVIDETAAQTFSNRSYPLSLGTGWTVMMQYVPQHVLSGRQASQQLRDQEINYVVLVREITQQQKEVKITLNHPKTEEKTVEIDLQNGAATVDGQTVQFNDNKAADFFDGYLEIYALPNGEVKVEVQDWFSIVFDGQRVKLTATSETLYDSVVGICGRFTEKNEDFSTPQNCIVRSSKLFAQSFETEGRQQQEACIRKTMPLYTDVITDMDVERMKSRNQETTNGVKLRNRYVEKDGEICFTISPVPECKTNAKKTVTKRVPVHCVANSKTAYYLKNQIERGGNPDFSHKQESKTLSLEVAQECY